MVENLIKSLTSNFTFGELVAFGTTCGWIYNGYKVFKQKKDINKLENIQDNLNEKVNTVNQQIQSNSNVKSRIKIYVAVTESFYKYGLVRLGKNSKITQCLSHGSKVIVGFKGKEYEGKVHSSIEGRIDGLTRMYKENIDLRKKTMLQIEYILEEKKLIIS